MDEGLAQRKRRQDGANPSSPPPTKDQEAPRSMDEKMGGAIGNRPNKEEQWNRKPDYFSRRERLATNAIRDARPPM
jgi:hypothetical protein